MAVNPIQETIDSAPSYELAWPEPDRSIIQNTHTQAPAFPAQLFGEFWSDWILKAAESKSSPPDYVGAGLLAVASSLIGNAAWASPWGGWIEPPVLWFSLVGIPSSGKSPGLDASMNLLQQLQKEAGQDIAEKKQAYLGACQVAKAYRDKWEEEVKQAVKNKATPPDMPLNAMEPEKISLPRLYTNDATIEAVGYRLFQNPKGLLLVRDEQAGWLGKMDKYGGSGGDRAFWLEAYGGRPYTIDRVKHFDEPLTVAHLTVAIVGGIQPDRLQSTLMAGDDDGLTSRFNFLWPDPVPPKRPKAVFDDTLALIALRKLHQLPMAIDDHGAASPHIAYLEEAAAQALQEFRLENHGIQLEHGGLFLSYLGKLPGIAVRLALVLELLWACAQPGVLVLPSKVSEKAILAALAFITDYLIPMAQRTFGVAMMSKPKQHAAQIAHWILENKIQRFNVRDDIQRNPKLKLKKTADIQAALQELVDLDWVVHTPNREGDAPGRQRNDYTVNPLVWTP